MWYRLNFSLMTSSLIVGHSSVLVNTSLYWRFKSLQKKTDAANLLLVVNRIFVFTLSTFIKYCWTFIHRTKLHGVKIQFWMTTLWTRFFYCWMLFQFLVIFVCLPNPSWFLSWVAFRRHFSNSQILKSTLERTKWALDDVGLRRIKDCSTLLTKRPTHFCGVDNASRKNKKNCTIQSNKTKFHIALHTCNCLIDTR